MLWGEPGHPALVCLEILVLGLLLGLLLGVGVEGLTLMSGVGVDVEGWGWGWG